MAMFARQNLLDAMGLFRSYDQKAFDHVAEVEDNIDRIEDRLGNYLQKLTDRELTDSESCLLYTSVSLEALSRETGLSPAYLSVLFKKETGMPLADFIQLQRVEEAKNLLRFSDYQISEISSFLAFSSQSYFTSVFKRHTGMTPKQYSELYFRKNWS